MRAIRPTRAAAAAAAVLLVAVAADLFRAPERQLSARVVLALIDGYRATLSPLLPRLGVRCRFTPSCSAYGRAVVAQDGAGRGVPRALWRILRCGPWTEAGTVDPP